MSAVAFPIIWTYKNDHKKFQLKILSFHGCSMSLKISPPPYKSENNISSEYGHVGYQTLCGTLTKRLVKTPCLCDLPELKKVQKRHFLA